jgi:hypothetical protein
MGQWGMVAAVAALEGKADQMVIRYWTPLYVVDKTNADAFKFEGISRPPAGRFPSDSGLARMEQVKMKIS